MSERRQRMFVESVSSTTVELSPLTAEDPISKGGVGIASVTLTTFESTAEAGFWGATGSCGRFEVIVRKVG